MHSITMIVDRTGVVVVLIIFALTIFLKLTWESAVVFVTWFRGLSSASEQTRQTAAQLNFVFTACYRRQWVWID